AEDKELTKPMTNLSRYLAVAGVIALGFSSIAMAQTAAGPFTTPPVPDNLQVPAGNQLFLKADVEGTQNYVCLPTATGSAWTFFSPQATGYLNLNWFGGEIRRQVITHFLSPNLAEGGTPRVTWQSSFDSSAVWGRAVQTSADPNFVA